MSQNIQILAEQYLIEPTDHNFRQLYEKLNKRLRFFIWKYVKYQKDPVDVTDEIIQRTFMQLFYNMSSYNGSTTFVTWLFTIARNEAFSYMRKSDKNISIDDDEFILTSNKSNINETADLEEYKESLEISLIDVLDEIVSEDTNEEIDVLEIKENEIKKKLNQVLEKINSLPIIYSTLLIDRFVNNLPYVDIALKNNLNINTVRTRLKKAKTLLSAIL